MYRKYHQNCLFEIISFEKVLICERQILEGCFSLTRFFFRKLNTSLC